ncbi:NADH-quinone oxidoreductase subunit L [Segnochrobactraceae bacterium EtOH-i3]
MYSAIVFLPLLGFLIAGLGGRIIGPRPSEIVTTTLLMITAALSWIAFFVFGIGEHEAMTVPVMPWIVSGGLEINWALKIDTLTVVMLVVVNTVSALVHLYSIGYMNEDPHRPRFFAYLSLFTFAMLTLVTSDNLVQMFFGWEGVGLASYLLIGFWYKKPSANAAAMKAFIANRVGDFGFSLGMFALFAMTGSVTFVEIFKQGEHLAGETFGLFGWQVNALTTICLFLFLGAMGKSAQLFLHTWLPDAMEGPTPVSALIHAATMVTAGVFMVARLSPLFEFSPDALTVVTFIGASTAFFAATIGFTQNDVKRVIAYSTCSQLGYMFAALGVGAYSAAVFHLFTHAFFKALLFLGAGSVITAMHHEQDMRKMGGLATKIPFTYGAMLAGTLALTGFPMTAGYFSKDAIIEATFVGHNMFATYAFWMLVIAAALTALYSWRLVFMTFHGEAKWAGNGHAAHGADDHAHHDDHGHDDHDHGHALNPHESPLVMMIPLAVLSMGALFAGAVFSGFFIGHGYEEFWKGALFTGPDNHILHAMHDVPGWVKSAPFIAMVVGFAVAFWCYVWSPGIPAQLAKQHRGLYEFLLNKWYFDELYDAIFVRPTMRIGKFLWTFGDGRIIDGLGPNAIAARVVDVTNRVVRLQTGYLYHYAFAMLIGVAAFVTWSMFSGGGVH